MFFELFADTGAMERGLELGPSLTNRHVPRWPSASRLTFENKNTDLPENSFVLALTSASDSQVSVPAKGLGIGAMAVLNVHKILNCGLVLKRKSRNQMPAGDFMIKRLVASQSKSISILSNTLLVMIPFMKISATVLSDLGFMFWVSAFGFWAAASVFFLEFQV